MHKFSVLLGRLLLLALGLGVSAWGSRLALARVHSVVTAEAFINGEILTLAAPIEGEIVTAMPLRSGLAVSQNQPLLTVKNQRMDPWLRDSAMDLATERSRLAGMIQRLQTWDWSQPAPTLEANPQITERSAAVQLADQAVEQARVAADNAVAEAQLAASKYERLRQLSEAGAIARLTSQEAENEWQIKQNQVKIAEIELRKKQLEAQHQRSLLAQTDVWITRPSDAPKPDRQAYEALYQEAQVIQTRIAAQEKAIASTEADPRLLDRTLQSPVRGVLWEVLTRPQEDVAMGQPLVKILNCDRLWVDAFISLDDLPRTKIGAKAMIKPYGTSHQLTGKIVSMRSHLSGVPQLGKDAAINPPNLAGRQVAQLRIELTNLDQILQPQGAIANFCHVGQISEVAITSQ